MINANFLSYQLLWLFSMKVIMIIDYFHKWLAEFALGFYSLDDGASSGNYKDFQADILTYWQLKHTKMIDPQT